MDRTPSATDDRVVAVDDETAEDLFEALSSETARELVVCLQRRPATAAELATACDLPRETVDDHLDRLRAAGLVAVETTTETDGGATAEVFAPTDRAVVRYGETGASRRGVAAVLAGVVLLVPATALVWTRLGGWTAGLPFLLGGSSVLVGWWVAARSR